MNPPFEKSLEVAHEGERICEHNLEMLRGAMAEMIKSESVGGNASQMIIEGKVFPCVAANAYADPITGEMIRFANVGHSEPADAAHLAHFSIRMAVDAHRSWQLFNAVLFSESPNYPLLSENARKAIQSAIDKWNVESAIARAA